MKTIIIVALAIVPFSGHAQLTKGLVFLGGTLSSSLQNSDYHNQSSSTNTTTNNNLSISPSIGFLISDRFALGSAINYTTSLVRQDYPASINGANAFYKSESHGMGFGPFGRYYFPVSSSVYIAVHGGLSFYRANTTTTVTPGLIIPASPSNGDFYTLGLNFKPVFLLFPAPKWAIEVGVGNFGYNYSRNLPDKSSVTSFGISWSSFSFGLSYYFIKK